MRNVQITKTLALSLSADDWQLYGHDGRDAAATAINTGVEEALNKGDPEAAYAVLACYAAFGACDSEGCSVLRSIMRTMG